MKLKAHCFAAMNDEGMNGQANKKDLVSRFKFNISILEYTIVEKIGEKVILKEAWFKNNWG